jgi:sugar phosphate isomerase/epimerase
MDTQLPASLSLDGLPTDARSAFALASDAGFRGIAFATNHRELTPDALGDTARRHLKKLLTSRNLRIDAIRAAAPRAGITDPATIDRTVDNVKAALQLAHQLGVHTLALNLGPLSSASGVTPASAAAVIRELAQEADAAGVTLALSADAAAPLEELLKTVNADHARANLDAARLIAAGNDPLHVAESLAPRLGQFTAADAVRAGNTLRSAYLGEGQLPLVEMLEVLDNIGFQGPSVVDVRDLADPAAGARHAAEVLRKAWDAVRR